MVDVDEGDGDDEEGDDLGEEEAAEDGDAEWGTTLSDGAAHADGDGECAHHGCDCGHYDWSKANYTGFKNSILGRELLFIDDF